MFGILLRLGPDTGYEVSVTLLRKGFLVFGVALSGGGIFVLLAESLFKNAEKFTLTLTCTLQRVPL
jgi:hypothetical protein